MDAGVEEGEESMAKDPVCGMEVDEKTTPYKSMQGGSVYYFCSPSCQTGFDKAPEKYIGERKEESHVGHYGGGCGGGCGAPAGGSAWYFYIGLLLLLLLLLFLRG